MSESEKQIAKELRGWLSAIHDEIRGLRADVLEMAQEAAELREAVDDLLECFDPSVVIEDTHTEKTKRDHAIRQLEDVLKRQREGKK